ncbi:MAG: response regulator [Gammaproteobacteria bacterium]
MTDRFFLISMKPTILLVDDERAILFAIREYFAAYGFEVDCARDKQEALNLLAERSYAVLITDLRLFRRRGYRRAGHRGVCARTQPDAAHHPADRIRHP